MTETVEPKPEFRSLAEDAVAAALQDPDPAKPYHRRGCPALAAGEILPHAPAPAGSSDKAMLSKIRGIQYLEVVPLASDARLPQSEFQWKASAGGRTRLK